MFIYLYQHLNFHLKQAARCRVGLWEAHRLLLSFVLLLTSSSGLAHAQTTLTTRTVTSSLVTTTVITSPVITSPVITPTVTTLPVTISPVVTSPVALPSVTPLRTPTDSASDIAPADALLDTQIDALIANMSPIERVGQLFVITFEGNDTSLDGDIAELINTYRIGGIVLSPQQRNFSNAKGERTAQQVAILTNQLQALANGIQLSAEQALQPLSEQQWSLSSLIDTEQKANDPAFIPLLLAVEQMGDDLPATALRRDFTALPTQMALGATWNPDLTRQVGQIVGRELRAVGINLLLGPNLDVVDLPRTDALGAQGVHSFGGNPYWVSQMGRAYIAGVHEGSDGSVATIARHFPGQGNIDRLPEQEIATVQKEIAELQRVDLYPFFGVTRRASTILAQDGDVGATDGMMSAHTRYSALQRNSPGRGLPISLAQDLDNLLTQPQFVKWRSSGILMSDALGAPAIRRYYEATLQEYPHQRVAYDAFTAGHDLLYLHESELAEEWATEKQHIMETVTFFKDRYTTDPDFAAHVDQSLRRILRLKLNLYRTEEDAVAALAATNIQTSTATNELAPSLIPLTKVLVNASALEILQGEHRAEADKVMEQVARESITILYPDTDLATDALPAAPEATDRLLIFSDSRLLRECSECTTDAALGPDEIANIMDKLYGANATGQLRSDQIVSLTFEELADVLNANEAVQATAATTLTTTPNAATPLPDLAPVIDGQDAEQPSENLDKIAKTERWIEESNWLIFAMLDVNAAHEQSSVVVKQFLNQRNDQLSNKHVIVLALHAPYFLDATEISKLTAYYGVYSKTQKSLESAVRALFHSYPPTGAPPVDVPGTRFDNLQERLQPDPNRQIELQLLLGDQGLLITDDGDTEPALRASDVVRIRVGPILDLNGHPVPDGTNVVFQVQYQGNPAPIAIEPAGTRNGFANRDLTIDQMGLLRIEANSAAATTGAPLELTIQAEPTILPPTSIPTPTIAPTASTAIENLPPTPGGDKPPPQEQPFIALEDGRRVNLITLAVALLTIIITLSLLLIVQIWILPRHTLVRSMLWATIFGLSAYILYGIGLLPGANVLRNTLHALGPVVIVFIAMLLPLLWLQLRTEQME